MPDDFQPVIDTLSACRRVLITTHARPDGDALGSSVALSLGLKKAGIDSEVLLLTHLPRKYAYVFNDNGIVFTDVEKSWPEHFSFDKFDALLVADTGTWSQLPGLQERIAGWRAPRVVIDHHLTQENWADVKLVDTHAAAAGEIVAQLLDRWPVPIDRPIADALYLAITTDTGWFQFSNTRPFTLRLAARLMEAGVDPDLMYKRLYQNERAERVALQTRAMQSLDLQFGGRLAILSLCGDDFEETGANVPDTENLINFPLQIHSVEVSALIVQPPEGPPVRVSLRSKGQVDVARLAETFGGGGHARASGFRLSEPMAQVRQKVIDAVKTKLEGSAP